MGSDQNKHFNFYNHQLQPFAHSLRRSMTKAEACLWKYALKGRKLGGLQFRRQRPVLNYVADFMCPEIKLIIEVDGWTHTFGEVAEKDIRRQKDLEAAGFTVIRFTDEEILQDINRVIWAIEDKVAEINHLRPTGTSASGGQC